LDDECQDCLTGSLTPFEIAPSRDGFNFVVYCGDGYWRIENLKGERLNNSWGDIVFKSRRKAMWFARKYFGCVEDRNKMIRRA